MTIDELRSAAAVVRDATEEGENTATRIGQLFLDTVNTLCNVSTNAIKGYVVISSTSDLPTSPTTEQQMKGYLEAEDREGLEEMFRLSTQRRSAFDLK